jgi:hypothetical protein
VIGLALEFGRQTTTSVAEAAGQVADADSTRSVNQIVLVLFLLSLGLIAVGWWYARATRPVERPLEGLSLMSRTSFRRASAARRSARLDRVAKRRVGIDETLVPDERLDRPVTPGSPPDDTVTLAPPEPWAAPTAVTGTEDDDAHRLPSPPWPTPSTSTQCSSVSGTAPPP